MESLKFFIKENMPIILLYGICFLLGIVLLVYSVFRVLQGDIDKTIIRFILCSVLLIPALLVYFKDLKKLVLVCRDYKTQKKETKVLYVRNQTEKNCKDKFNGVYNIVNCSEKQNGEYTEYWLYRKNQIYDDISNGRQYKLTYYANSKCLDSIEPVSVINKDKIKKSNNKIIMQKSKQDKFQINDAETKKNKFLILACYIIGLCTLPFFVYVLIKLWEFENIIEDFYLLFCIICISVFILYFLLIYKFINFILLHSKTPEIVVEQFITVGIPVIQTITNSGKPTFYLKVKNEKGKKKDLFFHSTDILGLGDLNERHGYMGYGNFIGMKYEIEYYKISRVIKSMKIIE